MWLESSLYFIVMALSLLLICKAGAKGLPSVSGSVARVITGAVVMSSSEAWTSSWASCPGGYRSTSSQLGTAAHITRYIVSVVHS